MNDPLQYLHLLRHPLYGAVIVVLHGNLLHGHHISRIVIHGRIDLSKPSLANLDTPLPRESHVLPADVAPVLRATHQGLANEMLLAQTVVQFGIQDVHGLPVVLRAGFRGEPYTHRRTAIFLFFPQTGKGKSLLELKAERVVFDGNKVKLETKKQNTLWKIKKWM